MLLLLLLLMMMMMLMLPMTMKTNTAPAAVLARPHPIQRVPPPPTSPLYAPSRDLPQVQSHARAHARHLLL
jgi:hypothetical protein